jgi:hypothetical protein
MMTGTLLDRSAAFVRAVLAMVEEGAGMEPAIAALVAAERRHGVRILREEVVGSLASVWVPVRTPRPSLREFRALMARHPCAQGGRGDEASYTAFEALRAGVYGYGDDAQTPDGPLFGLLTETSLLLGGTDFSNDHWVEFPGGALGSWTQRAWGDLLCRWARSGSRAWRAEEAALWQGDMGYAFFTFYLYTAVPEYDAWCSAALAVIREKCERQLED